MKRQKVSEIARKLGVSCQSVYKKLSRGDTRLTPHVTKEGSATFIDDEGFAVLADMFGKQDDKPVSPVDTQVESLVIAIKEQLREKQSIIEKQQQTIDRMFQQQEAMLHQQEEARKRTDTILMKLTTDISTLQKAIEYKATEREPTPAPEVKPLPVAVSVTPAPIRAEVPRKVVQKPEVQRQLSAWEGVTIFLDDCAGLLFGRG